MFVAKLIPPPTGVSFVLYGKSQEGLQASLDRVGSSSGKSDFYLCRL
jgi:hypothetical protein